MSHPGVKNYNLLPKSLKIKLEDQCRRIVRKASKAVPGKKNEEKVAELLHNAVCSEVKNIDRIFLKKVAEELAKIGKKYSAKSAPTILPPNIRAVAKIKAPDSGTPSIDIPITSFILNRQLGTTGKFSLKIWADPKDPRNKAKGFMLNFTIANF